MQNCRTVMRTTAPCTDVGRFRLRQRTPVSGEESDLQQGAQLRGGERDVLVAHDDLQLLPPHPVWHRPAVVVFLHQLRVR